MFIDTHAHIFDEAYNDYKVSDILNNAYKNNVYKVVCIGYDKKSNNQVLELSKEYKNIYSTIGIHPSEVKNCSEKDLDDFIEFAYQVKDKIVAIGECGLDFYWDKDNISMQELFFRRQIELAIELNLPIVVHSRESIQKTYDILASYKGRVRGVMHCYSGSYEMGLRFIELGFMLGIGGVVTFKNAKNIIEVVEKVSIEQLVLETDCPYLTPAPHRGTRNEPAFIPLIAQKIAEIKHISVEEVSRMTSQNAIKLYNIE